MPAWLYREERSEITAIPLPGGVRFRGESNRMLIRGTTGWIAIRNATQPSRMAM